VHGRFVFRGLTVARSLPIPRFHQGVGVEAPMRHLFVAIAVRGCIQEVRLGMDFTRFNRHLLRSKLNWRISHEESQIPSAIQS
jgi:hypothetical protein